MQLTDMARFEMELALLTLRGWISEREALTAWFRAKNDPSVAVTKVFVREDGEIATKIKRLTLEIVNKIEWLKEKSTPI